MREIDLGEGLVSWLTSQKYDVYQEVQLYSNGGICDVIAVRDPIIWAIELKTSLSIKVFEQATRWKTLYRSVCVPNRRNTINPYVIKIAKTIFNVGILEQMPYDSGFKEVVNAPLMREYYRYSKNTLSKLLEEHKTMSKAGSVGGGYSTPYKRTIRNIKEFIKKEEEVTINDIMKHIEHTHHYSNIQSAKQSIVKALETWENNWCTTSRNKDNKKIFLIKKEDPI